MSSGTAIRNGNDVTIGDYASDVRSWAATILKRTGGKCIWVLGRSEGGLVGMVAAKDNPPDIGGLLLVATAGRPFGRLIKEPQSRRLKRAFRDRRDLPGRRTRFSDRPAFLRPAQGAGLV
jgi:pimeloyl-ACP methyl ester carboxylesterase